MHGYTVHREKVNKCKLKKKKKNVKNVNTVSAKSKLHLRVHFMEHAYHKHVSMSMWASQPHACKRLAS